MVSRFINQLILSLFFQKSINQSKKKKKRQIHLPKFLMNENYKITKITSDEDDKEKIVRGIKINDSLSNFKIDIR